MSQTYISELDHWAGDAQYASELIHICNRLWLSTSTELVLFRKPLYNTNCSQVLVYHQYAREVHGFPIDIRDSLMLASAIASFTLCPSRIDLARLATEWRQEQSEFESADDFVRNKLNKHIGRNRETTAPKDVVLYGFGRIGRLVARLLISEAGQGEQIRLRAIVVRSCDADSLAKRADLLRYDSVHGTFAGTIALDTEHLTLTVNGQIINFIESTSPQNIDYTKYGIDHALVIDNTGAFRDPDGLSLHLKAGGVDHVLLTAPGRGGIPNIVAGVNDILPEHGNGRLYSAASCTTNAIVPVLKVMDEHFGIKKGHIETIHSYTNDQNLLDNYHKKYRRGRSAGLNLVITETGAANAVAKVMPHLKGKLTGNAVRVPTPNVSLAILQLTLRQPMTKADINNTLREAANHGPLIEQLDYSTVNELVSSDLIGNNHAGIVDGPATQVSDDGTSAIIYVWYDNECGYSNQVVRLAKNLSDVALMSYC